MAACSLFQVDRSRWSRLYGSRRGAALRVSFQWTASCGRGSVGCGAMAGIWAHHIDYDATSHFNVSEAPLDKGVKQGVIEFKRKTGQK
jgi:hypothetical protein